MQITQKINIEIYTTHDEDYPFIKWLESLKDKTVRHRIKECLDRIALGNLGDYKQIAGGIFELRFTFGAGCRIYFGQVDKKIILLLCGGNKSTQKKDIKKALVYWQDYLEVNND